MIKHSTSFENIEHNSENPFEESEFYLSLERAKLLTHTSGWNIRNISNEQSTLPGFIKTHSYGEYIFDWEWAHFFGQNGLQYYPKLTHTTPFSPVNSSKILGKYDNSLFKASLERYLANDELSSEHYLFINDQEQSDLEKLGFSTMHTLQYHFHNRWDSFDNYLLSLKASKRKMIKRERKKVKEYGLEIRWLKEDEYTSKTLSMIYMLYLSTIAKKNSQAYLNKDFFLNLEKYSSKKRRILIAVKNGEIIAMSLYFCSEFALYGRYWGIHPNHADLYEFLHFEMCYYRGIDFSIENKLPLFEAGAQGEQKLVRGFTPVIIKSAHHIKNPVFFKAISDYIRKFNHHTKNQIEYLKKYLPYKVNANEEA